MPRVRNESPAPVQAPRTEGTDSTSQSAPAPEARGWQPRTAPRPRPTSTTPAAPPTATAATPSSSTPQASGLTNPRFAGDSALQLVAAGRAVIGPGGGSKETVQRIQQALVDLGHGLPLFGADGKFGAETAAALKQFQMSKGLPDTGRLDANALRALDAAAPRQTGGPSGPTPSLPSNRPQTTEITHQRFAGDSTLELVARGQLTLGRGGGNRETATRIQQALVDLHYRLPRYGVDGSLGGETELALKQFQRDQRLPDTGRLDAATLQALDRAAPPPGTAATVYPEYDAMFRDGVLDVTLGVGFDEDGSDLWARQSVLNDLAQRGFQRLEGSGAPEEARRLGIDPSRLEPGATYYARKFQHQGKDVVALVRWVDRYTSDAKTQFGKGMSSSDMVLYAGHARYGSGPDFDTKESTAGNFVIGANARGHRTGALTPSYDGHMREILRGAGNDLERTRLSNDYQLMSFFGCTTEHYLDELRSIPQNKSSANLDVVASNEVLSWGDVGGSAIIMLDGVMAGRSMNEMQATLNRKNDGRIITDGFGGNPARP